MKNLINNIENNKEIVKNIKKLNYYDASQLAQDIKTYIKAIKERRMLCIIESVSASGMSRVIKFNSCEMGKDGANYRQYSCLFIAMGYTPAKNSDGFRINGCGMDMVFSTNYNLMHDFKRLGFITPEECGNLAQQTPVKL